MVTAAYPLLSGPVKRWFGRGEDVHRVYFVFLRRHAPPSTRFTD